MEGSRLVVWEGALQGGRALSWKPLTLISIALLGGSVAGAAWPESSEEETLAQYAWEVLVEDWETAQDWEQIHAAEVLLDLGHIDMVRSRMLAVRARRELSVSRVGVWRVLARTAPDPRDRNFWVSKIEKVFWDLNAPDRAQAIETMAKLKEPGSSKTQKLARRWLSSDRPIEVVVAVWYLAEAHDREAKEAVLDLLRSDEANMRRLGGYVLTRLGTKQPEWLRLLAESAETEPDDSVAAPYLLSAALNLSADPLRSEEWLERLMYLSARAPANAQLESARAMLPWFSADMAEALALQLGAADVDARIGAAWVILNADAR